MSDLNVVALNGRLVRDPEIRELANGKSVGNLSVAVNTGSKDKEDTTFVDVTVWEQAADFAKNYLTKGRLVSISGRLKQERWEKDGEKRSRIVVVANSISALGGKPNESQQESPQSEKGDLVGSGVNANSGSPGNSNDEDEEAAF